MTESFHLSYPTHGAKGQRTETFYLEPEKTECKVSVVYCLSNLELLLTPSEYLMSRVNKNTVSHFISNL